MIGRRYPSWPKTLFLVVVFSTNATDKVQIFKDLVTIIDKKAIVEYDVIHLRDEHKKYKEIKTQLRMRK